MRSGNRIMALSLLALCLSAGAVWSQSPDYSDPYNWIMPATSNHPVDVFYVYPTVSGGSQRIYDSNE